MVLVPAVANTRGIGVVYLEYAVLHTLHVGGISHFIEHFLAEQMVLPVNIDNVLASDIISFPIVVLAVLRHERQEVIVFRLVKQ